MTQPRRLARISISLALFSVSMAYAAEPISLHQQPFSTLKKRFPVQLPGIVTANGVKPNQLRLVRQHRDKNRVLHTRMQQMYYDFPVFGGYAIIHDNQSVQQLWTSVKAQPNDMNGVLYGELAADLGKPSPDFVKSGADALASFKAGHAQGSMSDERVTPMVYVDQNHQAHWAYQVSVLISKADGVPERPTAIVDAITHLPFVKWNDVKTVRTAVKGSGYGGNQHTGLLHYGEGIPLLDFSRNDVTGVCYMENEHVKVVDMMHRYEGRSLAMHFMCKDTQRQPDGTFITGYKADGYDRINGAYSPTNDALYVGKVIHDMYHNWFGLNALEENGKEKPLIMRVHFGFRFENAFWDGKQMTYGDGASTFYPLVSLGIGAHEISHGFTEQHSNLIYFGQSGGMNESFSDMADQAAEFYATGLNNWKIGAEIIKDDEQIRALRYMDQPSLDGVSIERADQYQSDMDVHHTSGVYNRLFYLLSNQPGWDVRKAFEVMVMANMDYWTPTSTFDEGACGILKVAKNYHYSIADVQAALDQVSIGYSNCFDDSGNGGDVPNA